MRTCKTCNKELTKTQKNFCSRECLHEGQRRDVAFTCQNCGKAFTVKGWKANKGRGKYCSPECFHQASIGHPGYNRIEPEEKVCIVCGKAFLVGGRGRKLKKQLMCSDECQRVSRYRHGARAKMLLATDAAYLAGFIDGEGSIMLYGRRDKVALKLSISNTSKPVLDWVEDITGVGKVMLHRKADHRIRTTWMYQSNSEAAESVIEQILPYLIIKKEQAKLALETQERLRNPALNADRVWQQEYIAQMRSMNKRGPNQMDLTLAAGMYVTS